MADFLNVYDLNRQKSAVLQNAFEITETQELNKIYTLEFKIPANDPKVQYIHPFHYVRFGDTGQLYRIIKTELAENNTEILSVNCEHAIAVLCDDLMFGAYQYGGGTLQTADVIQWLLSKQKTANWVLAECDFERRFEYNWEQENILNALYSIPKEFTKAYKWVFDTTVYPWKLSLKSIDTTIHPEFYIRAKRNLLGSGTAQDFAGICTRIYPLGYGEGVNQLTIKEATVKNIIKSGNTNVNADVDEDGSTKYENTYIQSDAAIVAQYGIKEKVLVDRRFEDANSLFSYGKTMLEGLQTPSMSRSFDVVDLYPLTNQDIDNAEVGKICKMTRDDTIAYITKTVRVLDEAGNLTIELSTKATDVASTIADLADRVRIESVYAQGATQLYQHSKDANATPTKGMIMSLYFPSEMRQINKVLMKLKLSAFRSYSQATESKTVTVKSCENVTVTVNTNEKALTNLITTNDGGGTTSSSGGSSVTVSGGTTSGNSTDRMTSGLSMDVNVSGNASLPKETETSQPSVDVTSESKWDYSSFEPSTRAAYTGATDGSGDNVNTDDSMRYSYEDGNGYTGTPYGSQFESHTHTFYKPYHHYHSINGLRLRIPALGIPIRQFAHSHKIPHYHTVNLSGSASGGAHTHTFTVPNHSHTISAHNHKLPDLSHNHTITLKGHSHNITLNGHSHEITPGIFESGNPTAFDIYVGGVKKTTISSTSFDNDIATWLLNEQNLIPRDSWIDIEIRPNDLAYCQCSVFVQGFVQSRGGANY